MNSEIVRKFLMETEPAYEEAQTEVEQIAAWFLEKIDHPGIKDVRWHISEVELCEVEHNSMGIRILRVIPFNVHIAQKS